VETWSNSDRGDLAGWKDAVCAAVAAKPDAKHMELVSLLKTEHGMGHSHANAVVAHTLAEAQTT